MFKKLLSWLTGSQAADKPQTTTETIREILTPPETQTSVAATLKKAVDDQITDAVTERPKKSNRRRKPKARQAQKNQPK
jgi:hypothetical protein